MNTLILLIALASATYGPYTANVVRVYDGDTFTAEIAIFPGLVAVRSVRLNGVDTPELRGKCLEEKIQAKKVRNIVRNLISGKEVVLSNVFEGKYAGRIVADVGMSGGRDLATMLLENGLAHVYDGGARKGWCGE